MFGYVRPLKGELLVREYEEYKGIYCTLCKAIGKYYGRRMRFALSYDICLYTMMALNVEESEIKVEKGVCPFNPLKKCNFICLEDLAYKKGAALTVLMTYHKILDNINDEGFLKKTGARFILPFVKGPAKKAGTDFPFMAEAVEEMMKDQTAVEALENPSVDACCEPTAKVLSVLFEELGTDKGQKLVLSQFGYFLGRWVYGMDASDDLREDLKNKSFNPLIKKLSLEGLEEIPEARSKEIDLACNEMLNNNVAMINSASGLLEKGRYGDIIENITEKGLAEIQREILFLHIKEKKKRDNF